MSRQLRVVAKLAETLSPTSDATVAVVDGGGQSHGLRFDQELGSYTGEFSNGRLEVVARLDRGTEPLVGRTQFRVPSHTKSAVRTVFLAPEHWPSFDVGDTAVPFDPSSHLVGATFEFRTPTPGQLAEVRIVASSFLDPPPADLPAPLNDVVLLGRGQAASTQDYRNLEAAIEQVVGPVRVGLQVGSPSARPALLDGRIIVAFRDSLSARQAEAILDGVSAKISRRLPGVHNGWLIHFPSLDTLETFGAARHLAEHDAVQFAEADVISAMVAASSGVPDDSLYFHAGREVLDETSTLRVQRVINAWDELENAGGQRYGNPSICIATLDSGIDPGLAEVDASLLKYHFSIPSMKRMDALGYYPGAWKGVANDHGTKMFGIVAARPNNQRAVAGMASGTSHVAVEHPYSSGQSSTSYNEVLFWLSGLTSTLEDHQGRAVGAPPLGVAADVICCAHDPEHPELKAHAYQEHCFQRIAERGGRGQGTTMVYAAGNDGRGYLNPWARSRWTLAVGDVGSASIDGLQVDASSSNFGPELDLCAHGTTPTIGIAGNAATAGNTSGAAATVAAAAALVRSAGAGLSTLEVRDILIGTATQVDPGHLDWRTRNRLPFNEQYGHGRVDFEAAVEAALARQRSSSMPTVNVLKVSRSNEGRFLAFLLNTVTKHRQRNHSPPPTVRGSSHQHERQLKRLFEGTEAEMDDVLDRVVSIGGGTKDEDTARLKHLIRLIGPELAMSAYATMAEQLELYEHQLQYARNNNGAKDPSHDDPEEFRNIAGQTGHWY